MRYLLVLLLTACTLNTTPPQNRITFKADTVQVAQNSEGATTITYHYPSCMVPDATTKEVVIETQGDKPKGIGNTVLQLLGNIVELITKVL
jgi:hypothetical protein